jgi:ubiquinone/menaquinone biosynthesis C-methylase UbiE
MKAEVSPHCESRLEHKNHYRRHFDERVAPNLGAYHETRLSFLAHCYQKRLNICLNWLLGSQLTPNSRVLDAGCGASPLVQRLTELGYDAWGLDHSFRMLQEAHSVPRGRFVQGDIEALPFPDEAFDAVVCLGVLDYLPSDEFALRELSRVIRKGGTLMLSLPQKVNVPVIVELGLYLQKKLVALLGAETKLSHSSSQIRTKWPALQRRDSSLTLLKHVGFVPQKYRAVRFSPMTGIGRALFSETMAIRASKFFEVLHPIPCIRALAEWCLVKARRNE